MTHRYSNLAEAQRAEAAETVMATGHIVNLEAGNLARLTEILEDHHASIQLCEEYGLSTESVNAAAAMELAEIRTVQPDLMLHYAHVDPKRTPAYRSRAALAAILGAKTEDERMEILATYSMSSLRMMAATAIFGAIDNGDLEAAYTLAHGISAVPDLRKAFFAA